MSLEELVEYRIMSMSRKEQRVADVAAAAYVISADEIRRSGAQSIPEALRLVPGLNVAQISSSRWAVSSRGFSERFSSKLLVQVDGRSIYSPLFAGVLWETQNLIMDDIERIEVIRGPGAALWGTNAMNGVINIVTRSAADSQGALVSVAAGSAGLVTGAMTYGAQLQQGGQFKVFAKADRRDGSVERDSGKPGDDDLGTKRIGIRAEPLLDHGRLTLKAEAYEGRFRDVWEFPALNAFADVPNSYSRSVLLNERMQGVAAQARYTWKGEQGQENALQASIDHDRATHSGVWGTGTSLVQPFGEAPKADETGGVKTDIDIDFQQRRVMGSHDFIWGVNVRRSRADLLMPSGPYRLSDGKSQRLNYSAFVHDEITLVPEKFKLIVGSKFEKDGLTGANVQPNVRLLYTPSTTEAYWGALSRSVRSLGRAESQATADVAAQDAHGINPAIPAGLLTAVTQISPLQNSTVKAESAISLEAGWRKQYANFLSLDAAVFMSDYSHLRGARMHANSVTESAVQKALACLQGPAPDRCYFTIDAYNSNLESARSMGGEFALEWHPSARWKMQASYSHLRVKGERTGDYLGDIQVSSYENSAPRHQVSVRSNFSLPQNMNLDVRLRYASQTGFFTSKTAELITLKPYTEMDVRLGWRLDRSTEISLMGRNLLKSRHSEFINTFPFTRAYDVERSFVLQATTRF